MLRMLHFFRYPPHDEGKGDLYMSALKLLSMAQAIADRANGKLLKEWIGLSHRLVKITGTAHVVAVQRVGRLDLLLRQIEAEVLADIQKPDEERAFFAADVLAAHSEMWVLRAYEIVRAAAQQLDDRGEENASIAALKHRLGLVRIPIAKGEIQGMTKRRIKNDPIVLARGDGSDPRPYAADGSYVMPPSVCTASGSFSWAAVDRDTQINDLIRRRDLADEMLALEVE